MSQYPAQPYGVQVQQVPQPGYGQPQMGYGQPPHPQAMVDRTVYVNGVPGHYEERMYPGPITCLGCLCTAFFVGPFGLLAFCCPCDKKTEFCPHGSMVGAPGGMVAAPPGATVTYYQQPQPVAQYQQPPQQQPGYYPKT